MSSFCKLCHKPIIKKSNYNQSKSITHEMPSESSVRRYMIKKHNINDFDEIMRKNINIFNKKYERYLVSCVLKLLTTTNRVIYIRINTRLILDQFVTFSENSILSTIIQDRY